MCQASPLVRFRNIGVLEYWIEEDQILRSEIGISKSEIFDRRFRSAPSLRLEIFRFEAGMLRNPLDHAGTDFFGIMEGERVIAPVRPRKRFVRAALTLDLPSELQQRREDRARLP